MLPQDLIDDVAVLKKDGYVVQLIEDVGMGNVVFERYPIPRGYNMAESGLLLRVPLSYRAGRPDMFWTHSELTLVGGGTPAQGDHIETYLDRRWRRFSWHLQNWNPAADDLRTYLEFVDNRLAKRR